MQLGFLEIFALFVFALMSNIFVLAAVVVGAYAVFRSRNESGQAFFGKLKEPEGDAYQAQGAYSHEFSDDDALVDGTNVDEIIYGDQKSRERFLKQASSDFIAKKVV